MSDNHKKQSQNERAYWLDNTKNVNRLLWILGAACAAVFAMDFLYVRPIHFDPERLYGFFGLYGFVCFVFIVFAGKLLRKLVMRDEDYYDR